MARSGPAASWAWVLAVAAFAPACLPAAGAPCDDGTVCPVGFSCTPDGCVSDLQRQACVGIADGASCVLPGVGDGRCAAGVCVVAVCGNGRREGTEACDDHNLESGDGCNAQCSSSEQCGNAFVDPGEECDGTSDCRAECLLVRCGNALPDPGEVCDDGNLVAGDGCTPDCASTEVCGNAVVDFFGDEQCDDGAAFSGDGCSAICRREAELWTEVDRRPQGLGEVDAVYDLHREVVLLFLGEARQLWEWNGRAWSLRSDGVGPSSRTGSAVAYDALRRQLVVFGGAEGGPVVADTWTWDGNRWTLQFPAVQPAGVEGAAMVFDEARGETVLFGGRFGVNYPTTTWAWNGETWRNLGFPGPRRTDHAMAYDRSRQEIVLFGGSDNGAPLTATWVLRAGGWQVSDLPGPPAGAGATMAYDARRDQVVCVGHGATPEAWRWNGVAWSMEESPSWTERHGAALVYDGARRSLELIGGRDAAGDPVEEHWARGPTSSTWAPRMAQQPDWRIQSAVATDLARGEVIVFGGLNASNMPDSLNLDETWRWKDARWQALHPAVSPPPRRAHGLAYDATRAQLVLFGGNNNGVPSTSTWIWDGSTWAMAAPVGPVPPSRDSPAMATDPMHGGVLLYGGYDGSFRQDTWRWDGSTWAEVPMVGQVPPARSSAAIAADARRRRVVLFGGSNGTFLGDTWEWDGTGWQPFEVSPSPSARQLAQLVDDPRRGAQILFGGGTGSNGLADAWSWDGARWTRLDPETTPVGRYSHLAAFDPQAQAVLVHGGNLSLTDTWWLRSLDAVPLEICQAGRDDDGDGASACADDDCWSWCRPACAPRAQAAGVCDPAAGPHCGDATCAGLETCAVCPTDCGPCAPTCGDLRCDATEDATTCPGDCAP